MSITVERTTTSVSTDDARRTHNARISTAAARSRRYIRAIAILQATFLAFVLSRSWFISDDLLNFGLAHDMGLTLDYLRLSIFGHFAPVHRLLDWTILSGWPLEWLAPELLLISMLVTTSWLLYRIVRLIAPTESWPTLLVALFAFSPVISGTAIWWAAAAHSVPAMLLVSIAALAALRYRRAPRWTDAALHTGALALGLLCYEKAALAPLAIAALLWATHEQRGPRAMTRLLRRCAPLIALSIVTVGLWAIEIRRGNYNEGLPAPSLHTWWQWFKHMLTSGPFAAAAGINSGAFHGGARDILLALAAAAAVTVVIYSIVKFRGAWRAWVLLGLAFFPGYVLTAYGRADRFGAGVASDPHYLIELAPALVLALVVAFSRPGRTVSRRPTRGRLHQDVLVALALVPVVLVSAISGFRTVDAWIGSTARSYFDNVESSATALDLAERPGRYTILDTEVPSSVVPTVFGPYNRTAFLLPLLPATRGQDYTIDERPLLLVLPNGVITPAELQPLRSLSPPVGSMCVPPTTVRVPPSRSWRNDKRPLFALIEGTPSPVTVSVEVTGPPEAVSAAEPFAVQQVQGSADGRPVRLLTVRESELAIAATPGSCLSRFTLLAARRQA